MVYDLQITVRRGKLTNFERLLVGTSYLAFDSLVTPRHVFKCYGFERSSGPEDRPDGKAARCLITSEIEVGVIVVCAFKFDVCCFWFQKVHSL